MSWAHMQIEVAPDDLLIRPMVGPGGLPRAQALAEVQSILDQAAKLRPEIARVAEIWRRGAQDDTVYAGTLTWTIIEHDGVDPMPAARAWLEDYARILRSAGLDVGIGWPAE